MFGGLDRKQGANALMQGMGGMKGLQGLAGQLMQRNMMRELFGDMSMAPPPTPQTPAPGQQGGPQGGGLGVPAPQAPMGPGAQAKPMPGGPGQMPALQKPTPQGLGALIGSSGAPPMTPPMGINPSQMGNHQTSLTPPPDGRRSIDQMGQEFGEFELPPEKPPEDPMAGVELDKDRVQQMQELEAEMQYWSGQPDSPEKAEALQSIGQSLEQLRAD